MEDLILPFSLRGRLGEVRVVITANDDPARLGCDLLDPAMPPDAARGFPVCGATPVIDLHGYAAACGWIQLVRSTDASDQYELDPLALLRGVNTPFAFFGLKASLFDAPFRGARSDLSWTARSFLCAVPDAVISKAVQPVAAFTWGFAVTAEAIRIEPAAKLDLAVWKEHSALLSASFPGWTFDATGVE
jgi:hypothetical protein